MLTKKFDCLQVLGGVNMKKILASAIIAIFFLMMPFVSFAKTAISDSELGAVSAQHGVTLNFGGGNVVISNITLSTTSYGDADGFSGYTTAGYLGATGISLPSSQISLSSLMNVDVGTNAGVTKLNIGLPIVELDTPTIDATIKIDTTKTLTDAQQPLGTLYVNNLKAFLNADASYNNANGSITIFSHLATQGISIGFNNVILGVSPNFTNISYGDADGFSGSATAGYLGIKGLSIGDGTFGPLITLSGTMDMDVGTNAGVTKLNVSLPTIAVGPVNISAPLYLNTNKNFTDAQPLFALVYLGGGQASLTGGPIRVFAH